MRDREPARGFFVKIDKFHKKVCETLNALAILTKFPKESILVMKEKFHQNRHLAERRVPMGNINKKVDKLIQKLSLIHI